MHEASMLLFGEKAMGKKGKYVLRNPRIMKHMLSLSAQSFLSTRD